MGESDKQSVVARIQQRLEEELYACSEIDDASFEEFDDGFIQGLARSLSILKEEESSSEVEAEIVRELRALWESRKAGEGQWKHPNAHPPGLWLSAERFRRWFGEGS